VKPLKKPEGEFAFWPFFSIAKADAKERGGTISMIASFLLRPAFPEQYQAA
jgi:hypothetical protein